jgi:predicted nuclease of predicted toxin-antitoxin system
MKLLLDLGTPRSAAAILRNAGLDTVHTGEVGLAQAEDTEIIRQADEQDRIVVTLDADFHALLALAQAKKPSVIRFRVEGLRADEFVELLQKVLPQCEDDLNAGAMVSVTDSRIRIRRLPIA